MRLKPLNIAIYAGITALWLLSMGVLINRHYGHRSADIADGADLPEELLKEQWMGIYQAGKKIGYSMTKTEPLSRSIGNGYKTHELVFMRTKVIGIQKDIKMTSDAILDKAFRLSSFVFNLESDINMTINGSMKENGMDITVEIAGIKSGQRISLSEPPYTSFSLLPDMLKSGVKKGQRIKKPVMEPSALTVADMEIEVLGEEEITVMGEKINSFKLRGLYQGLDVLMWITDKGEVLKEESMGFLSIKEDKENAQRMDGETVDLIKEVSIPFDMKLPQDVSYLKVRLSGIKPDDFELNGGTQRLIADVLEITAPVLNKIYSEPNGMDEYLKDTLFVQSKDPEIVSVSREIVGAETNILEKARLIYQWVYVNIDKTPAMTIPSAKEVLKAKRGDCNEHTTLYTALSRASGIPTRIAVGITYVRGYFYYHAWPEIYLNEWIPIDPTLGEFPANASHIRLLTGGMDKQVKLMSVIGKLKLHGIEYRVKAGD
ncbi:MAG: transglutaminase domain-containing protein [Nitrospirae bacterium]|nr:transglutaminase domain-containing protein [Nitrospirota bacterium]